MKAKQRNRPVEMCDLVVIDSALSYLKLARSALRAGCGEQRRAHVPAPEARGRQMRLARRHFRDLDKAWVATRRAMEGSAYVEVTPMPHDWYEVAVKQDRAAVLPAADGKSIIDPDA